MWVRSASAALLLLASPVAAQTYEATLLEPQIAGSPNTMTPLSLGDDNTRQIDLGFDFTYWGQTFSSAWVGSNGTVSFSTPAHLCCSGMPMENAPRNTIYAFWTDLISYSGNPYYARKPGSILFGWYGTAEFGTNNQYTFEVSLSDDNAIQFNYGSMPNMYYHYAAAGITGPEWGDNIQLFYGRDPRPMQYHSGKLVWTEPEPVIAVDCAVTPLDPSCPPQMVAPVQEITAAPIETIHDAAAADAQADQAEVAAVVVPEPEQEVVVSQTATQTESVTEQVAAALEAAPERLSPDQVAALAATSQPELTPIIIPATTVVTTTNAAGPSAFSAAFEAVPSPSNTLGTANTMEVLSMSVAPPSASAPTTDTSTGAMAVGQQDTMDAMAAMPAFTAYTQVSLQDRPDFYATRDIYKNRRLRDANFEMYRMTHSNSTKWQEMVDEQYGR